MSNQSDIRKRIRMLGAGYGSIIYPVDWIYEYLENQIGLGETRDPTPACK
jgi:hypothetical protein